MAFESWHNLIVRLVVDLSPYKVGMEAYVTVDEETGAFTVIFLHGTEPPSLERRQMQLTQQDKVKFEKTGEDLLHLRDPMFIYQGFFTRPRKFTPPPLG